MPHSIRSEQLEILRVQSEGGYMRLKELSVNQRYYQLSSFILRSLLYLVYSENVACARLFILTQSCLQIPWHQVSSRKYEYDLSVC